MTKGKVIIHFLVLAVLAAFFVLRETTPPSPYSPEKSVEVIYFDPSDKQWKDQLGVCHSCLPEYGFLPDGQIEGQEKVSWVQLRLKLKNDLEENPPIDEVRDLFIREYSANPKWFGTSVELNSDIFTVTFASPQGLERRYQERAGALRAHYSVVETVE